MGTTYRAGASATICYADSFFSRRAAFFLSRRAAWIFFAASRADVKSWISTSLRSARAQRHAIFYHE